MPPQLSGGDRETRRLLKLFRGLSEADRRSLIDYAEFLAARERPPAPVVPMRPVAEPRPAQESVIAAIKRLRRVYPMLDRERMLGETSALMAGHLLQGRSAAEVIDELEALFARHYEQMNQPHDV